MNRHSLTRLLAVLALAAAPVSAARPAQESCDCEVQRPATLAVVNNISIPTSAVEADTADLVGRLKLLMNQVREQALQKVITDRLLLLEAQKRGITPSKLIQEEVVAKAGEPTDEELREFYDRNSANMEGKSFAELQENLRLYVRTQRQQVQMTILTTDLRTAGQVQILEYSPTAPATEADRAKVLAVVNGSKITSGDLEDSIRPALFGYRHKIWEIERDALDSRIDDILVDQEARRRGTTVEALTAAEIAPKAKKVDAFDASKFYNENKDQFNGRPFAELKEDLVKFLQESELLEAKHAFAEPLRKTASVKYNLVEPVPPTYEIATAGRPSSGPATAPVTIVVFSDFECPRCKAVHGRLDALLKEYAGKVRLVARNYPLEQHALAHKAAEAAEAAAEQGKYWEYAELLFANQGSLTPDKFKQFATQLGLDRAKFDAALDSGRFATLVDGDLEEGTKVGVQATPSVYVNGRPVQDDTTEGLKAAVDAALKPGA
jgi:protein-disulfide isomerase